ncbi:serine hydrolase, partial [Patescibacteria group bacterium]
MSQNIDDLKTKIEVELAKLPGEVGLFVKFLKSEKLVVKNENTQFWAASVIKLPILVEFFKGVAEGSINPTSKIKVKTENIVKGSGIIHLLNEDLEFTLLDIAKLMIILSDNTATNELIDLLGTENVEKNMNSLGLKNTTLRHKMFIPA